MIMKQNYNAIPLTLPTSTALVRRFALGTALAAVLLWNAGHAAIVSPNQLVAGKSYSEWSAAWWRWTLEIPSDGHHPIKDLTGADALRNQNGPVWFLTWFLGPSGVTNVIVRNVSIPDDKILFVALADAECSTIEGDGNNEAALRACA